MAKPIDNSASRQMMRRAQKVQKPASSHEGKTYMQIGVAKSQPSPFGQILQNRMGGQRTSVYHQESMESKEERPEERRSESRESKSKGAKEAAQRECAVSERVREPRSREERREQSNSRDSKSGGEKKDSAQHAKNAEQRVVSKQEGRGGSGQESGKGGRRGAGAQVSTASSKAATQQSRPEARPMFAGAPITQGPSGEGMAAKSSPVPKTIPQRVLDQIVSYARISSKKDGETEMELALHEEIFKGLRMRITSKNGKIKATFVTSSRDVRELFLTEKHVLQRELTENGLVVEGINVIIT